MGAGGTSAPTNGVDRPEPRARGLRAAAVLPWVQARVIALVRWLEPTGGTMDPIERHHVTRLLLAFSVVGALTVFGFGIYFLLAFDSWSAALPLLLTGLLLTMVPLAFRATGALRLYGHGIAALVLGVTSWVSFVRGGFPASALVYLAVNPLIVTYLLNRREALLWTVLSIAAGVAFYLRAVSGPAGGLTSSPETYDVLLELLGVVGLLVVVYGLSYAHQSGRERSEEARKAAQSQLVVAQRLESVGQLAGGVAHDFNNVLSVILTTVGLAGDDLANGRPVAMSDLEDIAAAAQRAADLTHQLLLFGRREVVHAEAVDVGELLDSLVPLLRRTLPESLTVELESEPGVWPALVDATQLEQVVVNLAVNARDAMPDGGRLTLGVARLELQRTTQREGVSVPAGRFVSLRVTDTGTGMPPEVVERAFEPFFTTKVGSTSGGLGLASVYGIVKRANGYIWIESELGRGTTFELWLPATDAVPTKPTPREPLPTTPGEGVTVLLVEDEPAVRLATSRVLKRNGYRVLIAEDGEQALALFAEQGGAIRLLLCDVVMPGMLGPHLAEQLLAQDPDLALVFVSGYVDAADTEAIDRLGAPMLRKPVPDAELLRVLAEVLADGYSQQL